jgi:hypothetical protein
MPLLQDKNHILGYPDYINPIRKGLTYSIIFIQDAIKILRLLFVPYSFLGLIGCEFSAIIPQKLN